MEIHPQVPLLAERGEEILPTVDLNYLKFSILCLWCDLPSHRNQTLHKTHLRTLLSRWCLSFQNTRGNKCIQ